jgi:hypothetical protein
MSALQAEAPNVTIESVEFVKATLLCDPPYATESNNVIGVW